MLRLMGLNMCALYTQPSSSGSRNTNTCRLRCDVDDDRTELVVVQRQWMCASPNVSVLRLLATACRSVGLRHIYVLRVHVLLCVRLC